MKTAAIFSVIFSATVVAARIHEDDFVPARKLTARRELLTSIDQIISAVGTILEDFDAIEAQVDAYAADCNEAAKSIFDALLGRGTSICDVKSGDFTGCPTCDELNPLIAPGGCMADADLIPMAPLMLVRGCLLPFPLGNDGSREAMRHLKCEDDNIQSDFVCSQYESGADCGAISSEVSLACLESCGICALFDGEFDQDYLGPPPMVNVQSAIAVNLGTSVQAFNADPAAIDSMRQALALAFDCHVSKITEIKASDFDGDFFTGGRRLSTASKISFVVEMQESEAATLVDDFTEIANEGELSDLFEGINIDEAATVDIVTTETETVPDAGDGNDGDDDDVDEVDDYPEVEDVEDAAAVCGMASDALEGGVSGYVPSDSLPGVVETFKEWGGRGDDGTEILKGIVQDPASAEDFFEGDDFQNYAQDLGVYAAPGIFLFVVTFLFGIILMCARWCCSKCCCKPKHQLDEYSSIQHWGPLVGLTLFSAIATIIAIYSISKMGEINDGINELSCVFGGMAEAMTVSFGGFFATLSSMTNHIGKIQVDIEKDYVTDMEDPSTYESVRDDLTDKFNIVNAMMMASTAHDGSPCAEFKYTTTKFNQGRKMDRFDTLTDKLVEVYEGIRDGVVDDLDKSLKKVSQGFIDPLQNLQMVLNFSNSTMPERVADMRKVTDDQLSMWTEGSFVFFSFVFFSFVVSLLCVVAFMTTCKADDKIAHVLLHCSWFFSWIFATVLFLLCGVVIPVALIFSDTCTIMADLPNDIHGYMGITLECNATADIHGIDACGLMQSCFSPSSNSTYYNVMIESRNISLPEIPEFPIPSIKEGFRPQWEDPMLYDVAVFREQCCTAPGGEEACNGEQPDQDALGDFENAIAEFADLMEHSEKAGLHTFHMMRLLPEHWKALENDPHGCGFVRVYYDASVDALCDTALEGLFGTIVSMFMVALCGWPQIIMSVYVSIRNFGAGQKKGMATVAPAGPIDLVGTGGLNSAI